jgi:hypothetical protein
MFLPDVCVVSASEVVTIELNSSLIKWALNYLLAVGDCIALAFGLKTLRIG